jgi:hypothetical protein
VLRRHELGADGDVRLRRGPGQRGQQARYRGGRHVAGRQPWAAVAQDLHDGLRPAHPVAAGRHHAERQAAALRLSLQCLEGLAGADRQAAGAEPHGQPRAGAAPLGLALEGSEAGAR